MLKLEKLFVLLAIMELMACAKHDEVESGKTLDGRNKDPTELSADPPDAQGLDSQSAAAIDRGEGEDDEMASHSRDKGPVNSEVHAKTEDEKRDDFFTKAEPSQPIAGVNLVEATVSNSIMRCNLSQASLNCVVLVALADGGYVYPNSIAEKTFFFWNKRSLTNQLGDGASCSVKSSGLSLNCEFKSGEEIDGAEVTLGIGNIVDKVGKIEVLNLDDVDTTSQDAFFATSSWTYGLDS